MVDGAKTLVHSIREEGSRTFPYECKIRILGLNWYAKSGESATSCIIVSEFQGKKTGNGNSGEANKLPPEKSSRQACPEDAQGALKENLPERNPLTP